MPALLVSAVVAFLLSLLLTLLWRRLLRRLPPPSRAAARRGPSTVPRLGGVAVLAAAALALLWRSLLHWGTAGRAGDPLLRQLAAPALLVLLVGVVDDCVDLSPAWKFSGQIAAAIWVALEGLRVAAIFHHTLPAWLALALTVLWLVGCTNAFNLIDGMDGLATGLALLATGTVLAHAVLIGEPGLALVTGVLFGALAGFLWFNFHPASIYLGDAGSLSIGFLLGCFALAWANKATTVLGLLAPFFALLIPMLDTATAIARRGLSGQPLFQGDERHLHHRLLRRGLRPRAAVLVLYAVAAAGALLSLLLADVRERHSFELVIVLFLVLLGIGIQQLGYTEFATAGRLWRRGIVHPRRGVQTQLRLEHWAGEIDRAGDYDALWACLSQAGLELDFHGLEFRAGSAAAPAWRRSACWTAAPGPAPGAPDFSGWMCQFPLRGAEGAELGQVVFWRALTAAHPGFVDDLAAVFGVRLASRLQALASASSHSRAALAGGGGSH